jgi:protein O-mannosyl-transferase
MKSLYHLKFKYFVLIAVVLGFLVYFWSLQNSFIGDDMSQIVNNPTIQSLSNLPQLYTGGTFYQAGFLKLQGGYYRPLPMTIYAFINVLLGQKPFYFHLIQIIFHLLNVFLIYLLLAKFSNRIVALCLSLIYLVHPINVEAVVYIANLQDVLFVFFGLLGLYLLSLKSSKPKYQVLYASICLFLSCLSKETGIVFLPLYFYYLYSFKKSSLSLFLKIGLIFLTFYLFLRHQAVGFSYHQSTIFPIAKASLPLRLINIPLVIWYYFKTLLFPRDLFVLQEWIITSITQPVFYISIFLLLS